MSQPQIEITLLSVLAAALVALAVWIAVKRHTTPEKREKRRRMRLHKTGRLGDALVDEVGDNLLYYSYSLRGVQYTASQDVTALRERLPEDLSRLIGTSGMKYDSNNPGNSILLCEEWSGLRIPSQASPSSAVTARDSAA
jgi:hypothetical protein